LANLYYLPRAPVLISTNDPVQGRFYLDLNRNGADEPNGWWPELGNDGQPIVNGGVTNYMNFVGDPEWIGVLQHPDQPYGPNNPFVARYAFIAVPIGNALDLNAIHNETIGRQVNSTNLGTVNDSFMRNQGVGSWEINLAAFLADLNTNEWLPVFPPDNVYYAYDEPANANVGHAFDDAISLLSYRYSYNYYNLLPVGGLNPNGIFTTAFIFPPFQNNIDYYSDGPLMTKPAGINVAFQNVRRPWAGADNTNHFFDLQELFNVNETAVGVAPAQIAAGNDFTGRLLAADGNPSTPNSSYNRYTFYRLLSQMGVDSAPLQNQINLNYANAFASFDNNGVVTNITYFPEGQTNFAPWTPLQFFTIAADRMLRAYSQEWLTESPSNYVTTYSMTANIGTIADPTNVPAPFGITDIPVLVSNQFVYTPAIQRVLQLAANMYDSVYYYSNNAVTPVGPGYPASLPSVFRPFFNRVTIYDPSGTPVFTNVYICGFSEVKSVYNYNSQFGYPLSAPFSLDFPSTLNAMKESTVGPNYINIYGVPWIIGAKKGFPNFNEFAMESVFQLTRKLQVIRPDTNSAVSDYQYNQMFNLSVSNQLGVECWNSYTNDYFRLVDIYVTNYVYATLTNDENFSINLAFLITNSLSITPASYGGNGWPGFNLLGSGQAPLLTPASFQIPLDTNVTIVTNSTYHFNVGVSYEEPGHFGPYVTTNLNLPYEVGVNINGSAYPQPHWWLMTTNYLQVVMVDHASGGIVDYVQLSGPATTRDLTGEIIANYDTAVNGAPRFNGYSDMWDTNFDSHAPSMPYGLDNQIDVSKGLHGIIPWPTGGWIAGNTPQAEIDGFRAFFHLGQLYWGPGTSQAFAEGSMTNAMQAPFTPAATVVQHIDWQANDPLVHYTTNDLNWPGAVPPIGTAPDSLTNSQDTSLSSVVSGNPDQRYAPWDRLGNTNTPDFMTLNAFNLALKDPLVQRSDDWDFPMYKLPTVGWLGRVHRGTPWQTVYLKSPDILREIQINAGVTNFAFGASTWSQWTGDALAVTNPYPPYLINYYDAYNTAPVQDRLLFDLFSTAPNDNATRGQLSVNVGASDPSNPQAGLAAWSALFSGVEVLSNSASDAAISTVAQHNGSPSLNYTAFPINPAGPAGTNSAVGQIVAGINQARADAFNTARVIFVNPAGTITNEIPAAFGNVDGLPGAFEHVGDILSVPQLSDESPFLNWNDARQLQKGISDEMYDWLPEQMLSLLRVSGTPQSPMRYVIYSYGQALKPAPDGIYTGSQALANGQSAFGMVTNYQVVAESATRAVVNFGSVETNLVTTNVFGNWISVPAVTNNTAQIVQFNALPPY
jgi:hypothetical protein